MDGKTFQRTEVCSALLPPRPAVPPASRAGRGLDVYESVSAGAAASGSTSASGSAAGSASASGSAAGAASASSAIVASYARGSGATVGSRSPIVCLPISGWGAAERPCRGSHG